MYIDMISLGFAISKIISMYDELKWLLKARKKVLERRLKRGTEGDLALNVSNELGHIEYALRFINRVSLEE